ncbi:unnamed protein product [Porites evermanni]|uniref:F5/8 type C domain-containing protein n=1 Tax=Porites evermanni TaxID=104178 RepID=A0ABN8R0D5_9CNID|nr:unnamed protein product [Porites evermanni]
MGSYCTSTESITVYYTYSVSAHFKAYELGVDFKSDHIAEAHFEKLWDLLRYWKQAKSSPPGCVNFDFERGNLYGWKKSGTAFNFQPTYGDNPKARRSQPARQQGRWWIGTYEKRPNPRVRAGSIQGDRPTGTLTSLRFKIVGPYINFLIGGGCNINYNRVELVINGRGVVRRSKGLCKETMRRERWNVRQFIGRTGFVRVVDYGSGGWGHINFDDLRGDIRCQRPCKHALGMRNRKIPNHAITASSMWDRNHAPYLGRLYFTARGSLQGGWSARHNNRYQYFQVDFRRPTKITAVDTQGRQNANQWVTQYRLAYSWDSLTWVYYKLKDHIKYFPGNKDRNTVKSNTLSTPIRARYVRIRPWSWYGHISMRVEFYGCYIDRCSMPLGAEDGRLVPGYFSASTYYNHYLAPWHGRVNHRWSWSARYRRHGQWLQVSLGGSSTIKAIATQGRQDAHQWVTKYTVGRSVDGMRFVHYTEGRKRKLFPGNINRFGIVFHHIKRPFVASHVRFYPRSWYSWISMRVELYGCPTAGYCNRPLGLQNRRLKNNQITASSSYPGLPTWRARLHHAQAWCARYNNHNQWIKFDFVSVTKVTGVAVQGRSNAHQWVTRYLLYFSQDNVHWAVYRYKSNDKYFPGSRDKDSVRTQPINPPIIAKFIRLRPRGWRSHICMRVEFYGCPADRCLVPLGMEDGRVTRKRLRASSMYNKFYGPNSARLQARNYGSVRGGWIARYRNRRQWIQVDLERVSTVKAVATQGRIDANQWVKYYIITFSKNGRRFLPYKEGRKIKHFNGNSERNHVVTHQFRIPFKARYVRLHPRTWFSYISLRMELYGCRHGALCNRPMGMQNGRIPNTRITASSNWDKYHASFRARLHHSRTGRYVGSWCAKTNNRYQWLQVDFAKAAIIIRIATQGRQDYRQWVTQYYLRHSVDGVYFVDYKQRNSRKYFTGNRDQNTVKSYALVPNIRARFIRIRPWGWYGHISMRAEFYGCLTDRCKLPLGMEDSHIPSGALQASSIWNYNHGPDRARINQPSGHGRAGAWVAKHRNTRQWLQVDLRRPAKVTGVATQGRHDYSQWVTRYTVSYSLNGKVFKSYLEYGRYKLFQGNLDRFSVVAHDLAPPIRARFVRFHVKKYRSFPALRVEVYGCYYGGGLFISRALGMQSGKIKNRAITASSSFNHFHSAWLSRLHRVKRGRYIGAWASKYRNYNQWLQVDLGYATKITGIATQGRQDANQWVTVYRVYYSTDGVYFALVKYWWNAVKQFQGNYDRYSVRTHAFRPALLARYVRINPRRWHGWMSMRLELYGGRWDRCDMPLGLEDGRVDKAQMTSSSYNNVNDGPWNARLNSGRGWSPRRNDRTRFLQIDFQAMTKVTRVATQGKRYANSWVTKYYIKYGKTKSRFIPYSVGRKIKMFQGNYDRYIVVQHKFARPLYGRYFRVYPVSWYSYIGMRVEFYGCVYGKRCNQPLGMQNGRIKPHQLSASSSWDKNHGPSNGRLQFRRRGSLAGAWCARHNTRYQWLQVYFGRAMRVVKVATQGRQDYRQWVTQYYLSYSQDGAHFAEFKINSNRKYFRGNRDQNTVVQHRLFPQIKAHYIRVHPWGWYKHVSMRVELYGCSTGRCSLPLGLEDKRITNGLLSASTYYNAHLAPWHGRLNHRWSWSARTNNLNQWFQVSFVVVVKVTGIATQGRQDYNQWVTQYIVSYSPDSTNFRFYREGRSTKVRGGRGGLNRHSIIHHDFVKPFSAVHIRIYPRRWYGWISMRAEFYGCFVFYIVVLVSACNKPLGLQNGRLRNSKITASSEWNHKHAAWLGRLGRPARSGYAGAWCAKHNNHYQWIKFDFSRPMRITQVATQGRQDYDQWVTRYTITSSVDGTHWAMYRDKSQDKYFQGNRDRNSIVTHAINPPILARYVRIHPRGWRSHISMRVELYGCRADPCDVPLGMQDGRVSKGMLTASSMYNHYYGPWNSRLHARNYGSIRGGWVAKYRNRNQWIQIDLGVVTRVKRIATQGRYDANQWVKSYTVSYSSDGSRFYPVKHGRRIKIFQGNMERQLVVFHKFRPSLKTRYVRVHPRTWYSWIAMRFELYGCRLGTLCNRPIGMQSGRIKNHMITASSIWNVNHAAYLARLHGRRRGPYIGAWAAKYNNRYQWLQVYFGGASKIIRISTQGRQDANQWVTQYYVSHSMDRVHFSEYKERNNRKYFSGNRDRNTVKSYLFVPAIRGHYIRIHPWGWHGHISMRVEFYGCRIDRYTMPLGMEDGRILSGHLRASSSYNYNHGPNRARLNIYASHGRTGAWVAKYRSSNQWLQIDLRQMCIIKGIATQGRREAHQWVKTFQLSYSRYGARFRSYVSYGRVKVFRGNYDIYHTVARRINPAIKARYVRIHPKSWNSYIAMRVELYGGLLREIFCDVPAGFQSGRIKNNQITASSMWNRYHAAWLARLHRARRGKYIGSWSSRHNNHNQWLQVDFRRYMKVSGIATQGRQDADQWVTAYRIYYSSDGVYFSSVKYWWNSYVKTFQGNRDRLSVKMHPINPPVFGRYVRIVPRGWRSHISMRLELYGCPWSRCDMPLGLEDKRVHDKMMRASSYYNYYCRPASGRLNGRRAGRYGGAWCAKRSDRRQWLQVDFGAIAKVSRVATQGRQNGAQWVKSYYLSYSRNGYRFITYKENGRAKLFIGNYDRFVIVHHRLRRPITGRFFRFHPVTWYSWISMRVELYGCVVGARCNKPLGMRNGRIRPSQLSASSSWARNHGPNNGRLFFYRRGYSAAWCARNNNRLQWYQVNFGRPTRVVKVATQGRKDYRQWVTQYYLTFSQDGIHFAEYKYNSHRKDRTHDLQIPAIDYETDALPTALTRHLYRAKAIPYSVYIAKILTFFFLLHIQIVVLCRLVWKTDEYQMVN